MKNSKGILLADNRDNPVIADCLKLLNKADFSKEETNVFTDKAVRVLDDCRDRFGEGYPFTYSVRRRFGRIELRMIVPGERFDLFTEGTRSSEWSTEKSLYRQLKDRTSTVYCSYAPGHNLISVYSSVLTHREFSIKSPIVWALLLGLISGLICRHLPEPMRQFLTEDLANPIFSVTIGMMTGIMGPVIFLSMVLSVSSLESISKLTDLGGKIFRRFIFCTLFTMAVSIAVALCFYRVFSRDAASFQFGQVIQLLLNVFPTNVVSPFLENNNPQLVVLGVAMGAALLMLGEAGSPLNQFLSNVNDWLNMTVEIICRLTPVIPFISVFKVFASGDGSSLLNGWEFILGVYVSLTLCILYKLLKVSLKCHIAPAVLFRKTWPLFVRAFTTGSESATMMLEYELSKEKMGINPAFSSFWIPMGQAMLSLKSVVHLVIPPFLILKYTGLPITQSFLLVLVILVLELSIASPGIQSAWIILFASLALPQEYVGIFAVYKILTTNYGSGCSMMYAALEQIETACALGELDRTAYV